MSPVGWIVTPGEAGFESQGRGLAEALGLEAVFKRVRADWPWQRLPGRFWLNPLARLAEGSDRLDPPWPDAVISCGKVAAPLAAAMRSASGGRIKAAHIQNPLMSLDRFDVVVAPRHDGMRGENVLSTVGAIHPVTPEKLSQAALRWAPAFAGLPRPLVGVLIGGSNGRFILDPPTMSEFAAQLAALAHRHGAGLAVTPSRRTGAENKAALVQALAGLPAFVWDEQVDNPYLGILALADVIVVTEDSVSMTSEALATGKPVYVVRLPGDSARLRRFQNDLIAEGYTRPFTGTLERWTYSPPEDTARAALMCRRRFGWK
jgi:mitochondrial fission protein ELM1